jgi:hypothetical protein
VGLFEGVPEVGDGGLVLGSVDFEDLFGGAEAFAQACEVLDGQFHGDASKHERAKFFDSWC